MARRQSSYKNRRSDDYLALRDSTSGPFPTCDACGAPVVEIRRVVDGRHCGLVQCSALDFPVGDVTYDPARHTLHEALCRVLRDRSAFGAPRAGEGGRHDARAA